MAAYGGKFESSSLITKKKEDKRAARREILQKAKDDYEKEERRQKAKREKRDHCWLLPDVEQRLEEIQKETSVVVEKKSEKSKRKKNKDSDELKDDKIAPCPAQRDEWMTFDFLALKATSSAERRGERERAKAEAREKALALQQANLHRLELNPFWKDGGDGLPPEDKVGTVTTSTVNDGGVGWLKKSLQRMTEEAERQQSSLEDVVAQRYGSMEQFKKRLAEAEKAASVLGKGREERRTNLGGRDTSQRDGEKCREWRREERWRNKETGRDRWREKDRHKGREREECHAQRKSSSSGLKGRFLKPAAGNEDKPGPSSAFQKPPSDDKDHPDLPAWKQASDMAVQKSDIVRARDVGKVEPRPAEGPRKAEGIVTATASRNEAEEEKKVSLLTDEEMNRLGAKLVKAEIMGNTALVKQLTAQLASAREAKTNAGKTEKPTEQVSECSVEDQQMVLFRTDQSGRAWPVSTPSAPQGHQAGRRKNKLTETHVSGERVRYFQDDDGSNLQELVRQEKMTFARDQNTMYARMAAKMMGRLDNDNYSLDDMFVSCAAQQASREADGVRNRALQESRALASSLDSCLHCFSSPLLQKHLLVAIGSKVYLSLPAGMSLTEGHCLICPLQHHCSVTQLDEDVWIEMQEFRSALVKMFSSVGKECVFMETFLSPRRRRHLVIECLPLPRELGDLAPIYFKKAIMESDEEWSMNKKLVDLSSKDVRQSIPRGLPYFAVNFGLHGGGFAHVVENEDKFPSYFGKEIVGGMMDLEPRLWRKQIKENFDDQRQKVLRFSERWRPFDCTKSQA